MVRKCVCGLWFQVCFPDPREDPKSRSLKGVAVKYPLIARVPNNKEPEKGRFFRVQVYLKP